MNIIGLSGMAHDSAAAVIRNNSLVAAIEEERVSRKKNEWTFPTLAIQEVLSLADLRLGDLDGIAFYWDDVGQLLPAWVSELKAIASWRQPTLRRMSSRLRAARAQSQVEKNIRQLFETNKIPPLRFFDHHLCHVSYAVKASGFDESAAIVIDGRGEYSTITFYDFDSSGLRKLRTTPMPHSLGFIYGAVTQHLGFRPSEDEYRIMGLAPYGVVCQDLTKFFESLIVLDRRKGIRINLDWVTYQYDESPRSLWLAKKAQAILGPPRLSAATIEQHHANIAHALQKRYEDALLFLVLQLKALTGRKKLVLCGGTAMNSVANGKLAAAGIFEQVFVPPAPGDQGCAIGAAIAFAGAQGSNDWDLKSFHSPYLGPEYQDHEIELALRERDLKYVRPIFLPEAIAHMISEGKILGFFQGRMEFGPRALGHRSILADPRIPGLQDRINGIVKFREKFRPFAASILASRVSDFFEEYLDSPYMNFVGRVKPDRREIIPAVTHVDGSCRIQSVNDEESHALAQVLKSFDAITGIPILLNTSFNIKGEPIVMTPAQAVHRFLDSGLDGLAIGPFITLKEKST